MAIGRLHMTSHIWRKKMGDQKLSFVLERYRAVVSKLRPAGQTPDIGRLSNFGVILNTNEKLIKN